MYKFVKNYTPNLHSLYFYSENDQSIKIRVILPRLLINKIL